MKKLFFIGLVMTGLCACHKSPSDLVPTKLDYSGQCRVHFEQQQIDSISGIVTTIWDSAYTDNIHVALDQSANNITFTLTPQNHLVPNYQNEYVFTLSGDSYHIVLASSMYEDFFFNGDSLIRKFYAWQGSGGNFINRTIEFRGVKN